MLPLVILQTKQITVPHYFLRTRATDYVEENFASACVKWSRVFVLWTVAHSSSAVILQYLAHRFVDFSIHDKFGKPIFEL